MVINLERIVIRRRLVDLGGRRGRRHNSIRDPKEILDEIRSGIQSVHAMNGTMLPHLEKQMHKEIDMILDDVREYAESVAQEKIGRDNEAKGYPLFVIDCTKPGPDICNETPYDERPTVRRGNDYGAHECECDACAEDGEDTSDHFKATRNFFGGITAFDGRISTGVVNSPKEGSGDDLTEALKKTKDSLTELLQIVQKAKSNA